MPVKINNRKYYRTNEALAIIGISRATFGRWIKSNKIADVKKRDVRGWRLFSMKDIKRIKKYAELIKEPGEQQILHLE